MRRPVGPEPSGMSLWPLAACSELPCSALTATSHRQGGRLESPLVSFPDQFDRWGFLSCGGKEGRRDGKR